MRGRSGRFWGLLALLIVVGAAVAQAVGERDPYGGPGLSSEDPSSGGALALALWLEEIGYQVTRSKDSSPGADVADAVFVLFPIRSFDEPDADALLAWVRRGGVLIYAPSPVDFGTLLGGSSTSDHLMRKLALQVRIAPAVDDAAPAVPFFRTPRAVSFRAGTFWSIDVEEPWVPLVEGQGQVVAATRSLGEGRVYVSGSSEFFSNEGIARADNWAFVLNALHRYPSLRRIVFDEYHHQLLEKPNLASVARGSPWGWAVAYAVALTFLFLLWGGRRFGPALVAEPVTARSAGDYIAALGGLLQRARALAWAQQQYTVLTRRRLGRLLGVRSDLPAAELGTLAATRSGVEAEAIAEQLGALGGPPLGQRELLTRVRAMEHLLRGLENRES